MEQYIPKSALVAEIRKKVDSYRGDGIISIGVLKQHCEDFIYSLDTLEVKEVDVWKTVDNINPPQADRNKIYCVFTKDRYILATVINHPKDEELLQWKCTEFPHYRYDMCEGDKYMQIV